MFAFSACMSDICGYDGVLGGGVGGISPVICTRSSRLALNNLSASSAGSLKRSCSSSGGGVDLLSWSIDNRGSDAGTGGGGGSVMLALLASDELCWNEGMAGAVKVVAKPEFPMAESMVRGILYET